jgi:myo-inositol-1(or 4)-monophosphatase
MAGVVYNPVTDECFSAAEGRGAFLNGQALRASRVAELSQALVAVSLSAKVRRDDREIEDFLAVMFESQAVRRMGSSALNLCNLAAGRFDAFWSRSTKAWDIAAGVLIVREAGGVVSGVDGRELDLADPRFIAAGTAALHAQLCGMLCPGKG